MSKTNSNLFILPKEKDLDGFMIRRLLPHVSCRTVGPFIFFDHMGPAEFEKGKGVNVRPHPHINLATVTYLFEGRIHHQDSLGSDQIIEPGAINWMIAGRGIVHSERATKDSLSGSTKLNGIQLWMALPVENEECKPSFTHHPKHTLPEFKVGEAHCKLLLGTAFRKASPVKVFSDLFYIEVKLKKGATFIMPTDGRREVAVYTVTGNVRVHAHAVHPYNMAVDLSLKDVSIEAIEDSHIMLLGGETVGPRHIFWNFVSSSKDRIEEAKVLWQNGPQVGNSRFVPIPNDSDEFIPL
jgi:redox-sensitive bicupin YhaK (pirin superfamily)